MVEAYLPLAEELGRRRAGPVPHLIAMLVGFGFGCAMMNFMGGKSPVILLADNTATQFKQTDQGQFLQPRVKIQSPKKADPPTRARAAALTSWMQVVPEVNLNSLSQMQEFPPLDGKNDETRSYLQDLSNEEIKKLIDFMIKDHQAPALEMSDDGDIYLNMEIGEKCGGRGINAARQMRLRAKQTKKGMKRYQLAIRRAALHVAPFYKGIVIEKLPQGIAAKQPNSACRKAISVLVPKLKRKVHAFVPHDGGINYIDENDEVLLSGMGRGPRATGDIPGVHFKVVKVSGVSILALFRRTREKPRG